MKRLLLALTFALALVPLVHAPARATTCSIPNTFTNGTTADANQVNANFSALQSCGNSIDYRNIGASGIYASQILPTTAAQATFSAAVGWTITTTSATVVPLTVNSAAAPTADLLDVSINGTKNVWVASSGALNTLGAPVFGGAPTVSTFTTAGVLTNTATGVLGSTTAPTMSGANITTATIPDAALVTAPVTSVGASGNLGSSGGTTPNITLTATPSFTSVTSTNGMTAGSSTYGPASATVAGLTTVNQGAGAPGFRIQSYGSSGYTGLGSSNAVGAGGVTATLLLLQDYNTTNLVAFDTSGNLGIVGSYFGTAYNVASRREWKTNVAPLRDPLAVVMALPVYAWCYNGKGNTPNEHCKPGEHKHIGPMANYAPKIIAGPKRDHIDEGSLTGLTLAALRELVTRICTRMPDVCAKH